MLRVGYMLCVLPVCSVSRLRLRVDQSTDGTAALKGMGGADGTDFQAKDEYSLNTLLDCRSALFGQRHQCALSQAY